MNANAPLSPKFLADLRQVYATLQPQALSAVFLSDLKQVYATLPVASDDNLLFLAHRFDEWRRKTKEFVRSRLAELPEDDPLKCPISLFRTMDYGRLEIAHTRTLAWLLDSKSEHGFGTTLLAALLRHVSRRECSEKLHVKQVVSELPLDGSGAKGRLDVLVEGTWEGEPGGWVLVIEAKVDTWEGEEQLQKYEPSLRSHTAGCELFLVFLTPDGRARNRHRGMGDVVLSRIGADLPGRPRWAAQQAGVSLPELLPGRRPARRMRLASQYRRR